MAMRDTHSNVCSLGAAIRGEAASHRATAENGALKKGMAGTLGILLTIGCLQAAVAQEMPAIRNSTVIGGDALSGVTGVSSVNMAAGDANLQSNAGTLAIGNSANTASELQQRVRIEGELIKQQTITGIKNGAFRQAEGWLSINQAAGQGNAQSNSFGVAMGVSASNLSDTTLQGVQADRQGLTGTGERTGQASSRVEIDSTAFEGARGVIQVNQSAGTGNATRNSFQMNMALKP